MGSNRVLHWGCQRACILTTPIWSVSCAGTRGPMIASQTTRRSRPTGTSDSTHRALQLEAAWALPNESRTAGLPSGTRPWAGPGGPQSNLFIAGTESSRCPRKPSQRLELRHGSMKSPSRVLRGPQLQVRRIAALLRRAAGNLFPSNLEDCSGMAFADSVLGDARAFSDPCEHAFVMNCQDLVRHSSRPLVPFLSCLEEFLILLEHLFCGSSFRQAGRQII